MIAVGRWIEDALCANGNYDPELWFAFDRARKQQAKDICLDCPVLDDCFMYSMKAEESIPLMIGVWGGKDETERIRFARRYR